jgi:hypothetical protein
MSTRGIIRIREKQHISTRKIYGVVQIKGRKALIGEKDNGTIDIPGAPSFLSAQGQVEAIQLGWYFSPPIDFSHYRLYRGLSAGFAIGPSNRIGGSIVNTNYSDTGVIEGIVYYYKVTAVDNSSNESSPSNESFATPVVVVGIGFPVALLTNI